MNCDNRNDWGELVRLAIDMAISDVARGMKPSSEPVLIRRLEERIQCGIQYRNGHRRMLRAAYGTIFTGIKLSRDGQAREAQDYADDLDASDAQV